MKPVVSAGQAWSWYVITRAALLREKLRTRPVSNLASNSTVVAAFGIPILSVLAILYRTGHEEFTGSTDGPNPDQGKVMAGNIFMAVIVYAVRTV